jgi:outer membrane autotransporter protein
MFLIFQVKGYVMRQDSNLSKVKLSKNALSKPVFSLLLTGLISANLYADCTGSTDIHCNSTVNASVYNNATLNISGANSLDVSVSGSNGISNTNNGNWTFNDVNVSVGGNNAYAIFANSNAEISINGSLLASTAGNGAHALFASNGSIINLNNDSIINTGGNNVYALNAQNGSAIKFNGETTINSVGTNSSAINANNSTIDLDKGASIATIGDDSHAIAAQNSSSVHLGSNSHLTTRGDGSNVFDIVGSSVVADDNLSAITNGDYSVVILADDGARVAIGNNSHLSANGESSYAILATDNASVVLGGETSIIATGNNSLAIVSTNDANVSTNGAVKLNIQGSILSYNASVNLNMSDGSTLNGDVSTLNGAKTNLSFDGANSLWQTGNNNSSLTNLSLTNNARVNFGDLTTTLGVVNLSGDNGIFGFKATAVDGALVGNKLTISNSSQGNFQIQIDDSNAGNVKNASQTLALVEQSSGTLSNYQANFTLNGGSVDIGQFIYTLNASSNSSNKNFYLLTDGTLNSAALSSISFLHINYLTNYLTIQTLLQRMGEVRNNSEIKNDIWVKANAGKLDSFRDTLNVDGVDYYSLSGGIDNVYGFGNSSVLVGIFADFLKADVSFSKGSGDGDSKAAGIYATYQHDNGFYGDFIAKYASSNNKFSTVTSGGYEVDGKGDTKGFSVTFEGGKKISFDKFYVEPQAALTYSHQNELAIKSSSGLNTNIEGFDSIVGRVSAIIGYKLQSTNIYFKSGFVKEFDGETSYSFNDTPQKYEYTLDGNFWDNALGLTMDFKNRHLYIEGTYQKGDDFNNQKINLGYKFSF